MSIEAYQNGQSVGQSVETFARLSDQISNTEFVPGTMRGKPAVVLACMMYGAELGLGPMQSLNMIQSIQGSVGLKPEGMRALVVQKGHRIWPEEYTDTIVTYCGWRKGDPADLVVKVSFTMTDAKRAGLDQGQSWKKYPRSMLSARATAELCRLHFADVIGGLSYTPSEIEEFDTPPVASVHHEPRYTPPAAQHDQGEPFPVAALTPAPAATRRRPPPTTSTVTAAVPEPADDGELVDKKVVNAILRLATTVDEDGDPIDTTQLQVLTFGCTAGRTDNLEQMTRPEADKLHGYVTSARHGRLPSTYATRADEWLVWSEQQTAGAVA